MGSVYDQSSAVAVALDRHFVPLAVVQLQGVDGDKALAAAEVEAVPVKTYLVLGTALKKSFRFRMFFWVLCQSQDTKDMDKFHQFGFSLG